MGVSDGSVRTSYRAPAPLTPEHCLQDFDSGKPALDQWLRTKALANEGRASRTYVVVPGSANSVDVVAYYTLATGGVALSEIKSKYRHNLPNPVPVIILARLAVDHRHSKRGLGQALLREAMQRSLEVSRTAGVRMLMVHAIDEEAAAFYLQYGFHAFPIGSWTLFLPIETIAAALQAE